MLQELRVRAKELYDAKDYTEALKLYEEIKREDDAYHENHCLFHYLWCIYRVKISEEDAFSNDKFPLTKEYIKYILAHQTNKDLLFQQTVFKVIRHYKSMQSFDAAKINGWLDKLDPNTLSEDTYVINIEGKDKEQQSKKEEWYSIKSKVYEKLEMYPEVLRVSEEALHTFRLLHNNNDVWFKRRIANSKAKLGNTEEAIKLLSDLLNYKKDWYIYFDLSNVYSLIKDYKRALDFAIDAILRPGEDSKKINLLWSTGKYLEILGSKDTDAIKVYVIKIKLGNHWKLSHEEEVYYQKHKGKIDSTSKELLRKQVINIANAHKWKEKDKITGVITRILPNNKSGFVAGEKGSYYFNFNDVKGRKDLIQKDIRVSFYLEEYFNSTKQEIMHNAVNINLLE